MVRTLQQGYQRKTQPETLIRRSIVEILRMDGWDVTYHQQGPLCRKGFPDLTALKDGVTLYIEVKTQTGKQSAYQIEFEKICKAHGGTYVLARSVDDIKPYLTTIKAMF
jgi:Holliday junction resolvase